MCDCKPLQYMFVQYRVRYRSLTMTAVTVAVSPVQSVSLDVTVVSVYPRSCCVTAPSTVTVMRSTAVGFIINILKRKEHMYTNFTTNDRVTNSVHNSMYFLEIFKKCFKTMIKFNKYFKK